jgi:RimJ/RimL family protein N-acetyltransferase
MSVMAAPPRAEIPQVGALPRVLRTERLVLHPPTLDDTDAIFALVSNPALPRYMTWAAHTERQQTVDFLQFQLDAAAANTGCAWTIEHAGHPVGHISLDSIRWWIRAVRVDAAELGYWIAPALHGKGLMTEAGRAVMEFAFGPLGLHKVNVSCLDENVASRRVIEKLGFRACGRSEDDVWRDGRWHAHLRYELTQLEWGDVSTTMRVSRPASTRRPT